MAGQGVPFEGNLYISIDITKNNVIAINVSIISIDHSHQTVHIRTVWNKFSQGQSTVLSFVFLD